MFSLLILNYFSVCTKHSLSVLALLPFISVLPLQYSSYPSLSELPSHIRPCYKLHFISVRALNFSVSVPVLNSSISVPALYSSISVQALISSISVLALYYSIYILFLNPSISVLDLKEPLYLSALLFIRPLS